MVTLKLRYFLYQFLFNPRPCLQICTVCDPYICFFFSADQLKGEVKCAIWYYRLSHLFPNTLLAHINLPPDNAIFTSGLVCYPRPLLLIYQLKKTETNLGISDCTNWTKTGIKRRSQGFPLPLYYRKLYACNVRNLCVYYALRWYWRGGFEGIWVYVFIEDRQTAMGF